MSSMFLMKEIDDRINEIIASLPRAKIISFILSKSALVRNNQLHSSSSAW